MLTAVLVGFVQVIADEGMPVYGESRYGDLFVEYNVVLPQTLSSAMRRSEFGSDLIIELQLTALQNWQKHSMAMFMEPRMNCDHFVFPS
jgi:DnaJ-class molecular chaperone